MVLTKGDLDEIGDKIWDITTEVLQQFEQQYMQTLGGVQKALCELQLQATIIHEDVGKVSGAQVNLA